MMLIREDDLKGPEIAGLLAEKGFEIDRRKITLSEPIREVGEHNTQRSCHWTC